MFITEKTKMLLTTLNKPKYVAKNFNSLIKISLNKIFYIQLYIFLLKFKIFVCIYTILLS